MKGSSAKRGPFSVATGALLAVSAITPPTAASDTTESSGQASAERCEQTPSHSQAPYQNFDFLAERKPAGLSGDETVVAISFHRQNVFPDADHLLAPLANRFNVLTRESTLRAALPFVIGDTVSDEKLEEAERILRRKRFLYDARVMVEQRCQGKVAIAVIVRDVWTLVPNAGVSRAGGDNQTSFGLTESNVLGLGKAVSIGYRSDRDRSGVTFTYFDPNILGSRWETSVAITNNDDGEVLAGRLERPFYALDARWATGVSAASTKFEQPLEYLSEELYEIDVDKQAGEVFFGRSQGRVGNWVDRYSFGFAWSDEQYRFPAGFPGEQFVERRFAYPFLRWQRIEDRFVTGANLDRVDRTEDLNLGLRSSARLGYSKESFGGDGGDGDDVVLFDGRVSKRWYLTDSQLLGVSASVNGRYAIDGAQGTEDLVARADINYLWRHAPQFNFYARLRAVATRDLDPESQLTLGGDTDLRGYPSRYQPGDHSYLATLEQRYYSDLFPFGLFRVGVAAFVDVGRAWFEDKPPAWLPERSGNHFGTLANVGIGLRLESIRTRRDRVLHIDIAHPLVDGPEVDSFQITLSAKRSL